MSPADLRALVADYELRLDKAVSGARAAAPLPHEVFRFSATLSLLSEALHDPDIKVRATLTYSPNPNALQREGFVRAYLEADRPADALRWLEGVGSRHTLTEEDLRAQALVALGRADEAALIRQKLFDASGSPDALKRWLDMLPATQHDDALSHARDLAMHLDDPMASALLLLELGDPNGAEERLVAAPERIAGGHYYTLIPMADRLREADCGRGEITIYRALLVDILARAYARAYAHAAEYWIRLQHLAEKYADLSPLRPHVEFVEAIRAQHRRKTAFWNRVEAATRTTSRPPTSKSQR